MDQGINEIISNFSNFSENTDAREKEDAAELAHGQFGDWW